jgi:hypothetical protein
MVNGRSLRMHGLEVEGECLARTGPRRGFRVPPSTLEQRIKKLRILKSDFNSANW